MSRLHLAVLVSSVLFLAPAPTTVPLAAASPVPAAGGLPAGRVVVTDASDDAFGRPSLRPAAEVVSASYTLPGDGRVRLRMGLRFRHLRDRDEARGRVRQLATTVLTTPRAEYLVIAASGVRTAARVLRLTDDGTVRVRPDSLTVRTLPGPRGVLAVQTSTEWIDGDEVRFQSFGSAGRGRPARDRMSRTSSIALRSPAGDPRTG
ncbi:hypothetical protein [uncultured Nocardioides sp.]|uniref:hypothetical protein n=1 Tax=uncultured Nocardioides sp. TaxID=198441 RepID=UPI00260821F0|nr:hypothetical protein [uncultured Nocardioides sp.]